MLMVVTLLLAACKANDTAPNVAASPDDEATVKLARAAAQQDGARRVTAAELQRMLENGEAVVYDTRALGAYQHEHLTGAQSLPSAEVLGHIDELPRDKTLVFYCT
jgi:hypothetical protein